MTKWELIKTRISHLSGRGVIGVKNNNPNKLTLLIVDNLIKIGHNGMTDNIYIIRRALTQ